MVLRSSLPSQKVLITALPVETKNYKNKGQVLGVFGKPLEITDLADKRQEVVAVRVRVAARIPTSAAEE